MKKHFFLLSLFFIATSCVDEIKFNNPAFQTLKDNVFWRSTSYTAYLNTNGNMVIEGFLGYEKIVLQTASPTPKTYVLGVDDVSKASYINILPEQKENFSTAENIGSGQVVITEFNTQTNTISGTFKFTAVNEDLTDTEKTTRNFTEGVFYKIPVIPTQNSNL
ncbi:DUF6252 family protein [Flavobacterium branchiicola]|uniref:DUF6252 family protein n=1 Tax=Flavobacterium branchiicola TaxID=1114875 RepID=A0ABV9PG99_9FLAO|nr:DUF6252 family protein [Flavobacterium branchiicola]MBS7254936.1 hypothetical protein [Flavobacterium branchiicola]